VAAEYEVNIKINTQQIERELKKVDKAVNNIGKGKGGKKQPILALPSTEMLNATARKIQSLDKVNRKIALRQREINKQTRDQALSINTLVKTQEKRARLLNKINEMEAKGLNVSKLRKQLAKATTEQSNRRFGSAEKEFRILEKSIRLEQSKLRILKEQRKGFAASPVGGTRTMMGSPAQIAAAARAGGATSPIRGGLDFPGSPGFLAGATASRTPFGPSFPTGGAALPIRGSISMPGSPIAVQAAKATNLRAVKVEASWANALGELQETAGMLKIKDTRIKQSWSTALAELNETASLLRVRSQQASAGLTGQSSPIGGATNIPGSPAFLRRQQRIKTLEQVGLGAGFPLLFGGGAGSVIGGGLGGLTGSFGAQIAFSAIGQQIDQFVAGMVDAGKALTSVGGAADFMAEKSLFSSDSMQFRIEKLIEEGQVTEAAALMTQEMAKQVGGSGLKALKDLGTEASKMGKIFSTLLIRVQAFLARALTPLLKLINSAVGGLTAQSQLDQMIAEAGSSERGAAILARSKELRGNRVSARTGKTLGLKQLTPEVIAQLQKEFPAVIPGGAAIEPTELERLRAADSGGGKAAREEERLQKRLGKLEEERKKVLEISRFRDRIAAAEAAEDDELVIRLQGEQRIAEIEANRLKALVGITDQREIDAINIGKATEKLAAHRNTERELGELQRQRQEKFEDIIENLEHQLKLAQATSEEERERLRIEKELQELREGGMSESQLGQVGDLMRQISAENSPLNQFIKQSVESLNNLEQHAVQVSQGIGNAIGNSLVNGLQNLVTGAESVKEVFANMLKAVADVLAQQAAQMIATYVAIGIARAFAGFGGGGKELNLAGVEQYSGIGANTPVTPLAEGGYVSGPTNALVGEAGEPEYVIPESKMRESMARYSRGARGSSVIPDSGVSGTSSEGSGIAIAAPIDVRYTVERINSVDYVTADQFQRGLQQAAAQGATQGEQRALTTLRQNTSQRRRIGL
jgi:hypothetical protein